MATTTTKTARTMLEHGADDCEQVATAIRGIGEAAKRITDGPLTLDAAALLIREAMPHGTKSTVSVADVRNVLQGAARVADVHLRAGRR